MSRLCTVWILVALLTPRTAAEQIEENLFVHRDSANVYILRDGTNAILIDLGTGSVFGVLENLGIERVEAIYLTHGDRDQWSGFEEAVQRDIPIYVPATDPNHKGYTRESIQRYWSRSFPVPNSFFVFSMVTRETDYPQAVVVDGAKLENSVATLRAVATPGHTKDHIAYIAEVSGKKIAFTGDLIHSPGKVWQGFQLDWDHWRGLGHEAAFGSLLRIKDERPDLIAPSHGELLRDNIEEKLMFTADRVWQAGKLKDFELFAMTQDPPILETKPLRQLEKIEVSGFRFPLERLSRHLWVLGNNYFLVADDGSCFAIDNDLAPELWDPILERIGVKKVDYIWVTHLHSDHTRQLPALRQRFGMKLVTVREMADLLEKPQAYLHPYANFDGAAPDLVLADREEIEWKGYRLIAHFAPGQTYFHGFLETVIDGHRVVFSGDSFQPVKGWDLANGTGGWSGLNRGFPSYHARSARLMIDIHPDWVLAEHQRPFYFNEQEWRYRIDWAEQAEAALDALSPSGNHRYDFNPHVFGVYPLISSAGPVELRIENPFHRPMAVEFTVRAISPLVVSPAQGKITVPANSTGAVTLDYTVEGAPPSGRLVVPIDITARGQYLGEACYFLVDVP